MTAVDTCIPITALQRLPSRVCSVFTQRLCRLRLLRLVFLAPCSASSLSQAAHFTYAGFWLFLTALPSQTLLAVLPVTVQDLQGWLRCSQAPEDAPVAIFRGNRVTCLQLSSGKQIKDLLTT